MTSVSTCLFLWPQRVKGHKAGGHFHSKLRACVFLFKRWDGIWGWRVKEWGALGFREYLWLLHADGEKYGQTEPEEGRSVILMVTFTVWKSWVAVTVHIPNHQTDASVRKLHRHKVNDRCILPQSPSSQQIGFKWLLVGAVVAWGLDKWAFDSEVTTETIHCTHLNCQREG